MQGEAIMAAETYIMGLFTDEDRAAAAVTELKNSSWSLHKVHSPIPSHKLSEAINTPKSAVGYFTLAGGILGFVFGILLAVFTATRWNIIVGGKPIVSLIPFFIVGFEFTILMAVFGNVIGMLLLSHLPCYKDMPYYDPRCSGEHFGLLASCEKNQKRMLADFFNDRGATVNIFDESVYDNS